NEKDEPVLGSPWFLRVAREFRLGPLNLDAVSGVADFFGRVRYSSMPHAAAEKLPTLRPERRIARRDMLVREVPELERVVRCGAEHLIQERLVAAAADCDRVVVRKDDRALPASRPLCELRLEPGDLGVRKLPLLEEEVGSGVSRIETDDLPSRRGGAKVTRLLVLGKDRRRQSDLEVAFAARVHLVVGVDREGSTRSRRPGREKPRAHLVFRSGVVDVAQMDRDPWISGGHLSGDLP